ncbi:MAG TPA: ATP-binding protein [Gemmataceae bacterium]|nr:ATP-binding protein [Gemmataceae bacterium]
MTEAKREFGKPPRSSEGPSGERDRQLGLSREEAEAILTAMARAFTTRSQGPALLPSLSMSQGNVGEGAPAARDVQDLLHKAQLRYRTLVEQLPAVTFMAALDEDLHELYVSPQIETLLGFSQQEWLANPVLWYTQLHPDDRERWQEQFALTCNSGVHFRSEYRFLARDGRVVWVHGECQLVRDDQGRPLFLQGIAYDITERKQAEEALRQMQHDLEALVEKRTAELAQVNEALRREIAERQQLELLIRQRAEQLAEENRRKDHFLAVLAHELRNPLAPMHTSLEILRRPGTSREVSEWAYGVLERQTRHMRRLIDDLLDVSRINQGKIHLNKETVNLAAVILRAVEVTGPLLEERRHELKLSLPPQPLRIQADVARLDQVAVNLLTNAAKYTEPGGRIWVTAEQEGAEAVLRVRDNGVGIPPEMLESIFDMFMQVDRSLGRTRQWGLGVGLALVRRLLELHGGSIKAFSAGPDQGSEFVARLPLLREPIEANDAAGPTTTAPPSVEHEARRRVLVVEDHPEFAEGMAFLLRSWGHEVEVASDGPSALRAVQRTVPDAVFLDVGLPGMSGYEVARQLRQRTELERTLLVAVTGYGREEDRRRAREVGFDEHLIKPVEANVLRELLARRTARAAAPPERASFTSPAEHQQHGSR